MGNFFLDVISKAPHFNSPNRVADMDLLEPATRAAVQAIIADAAALGIPLMAFETYRSPQRQTLLFEQGATQLRTVGVHQYGLACDLVRVVGGEPSWKGDFTFLARLANTHRLIWGGDWGRPDLPHSFKDLVHVQNCSLLKQPALFRGDWYPDSAYNPYEDAQQHMAS
jgi:hypothetical protein